MKVIVSYLDCRSPHALLWLAQLPQLLDGLSYFVELRPVRGAGSYASLWSGAQPDVSPILPLMEQARVVLQRPLTSDFDPLPIWEHAMQYSLDGTVNRYVMNTVMQHVWQAGEEGVDALCPSRLARLSVMLFEPVTPWPQSPHSAAYWLQSNTHMARAAGVLDFPACTVDGTVLVGLEGLRQLRTCVADPAQQDEA